MTPIVYVTDHEYSQIVGRAFAKGADAYVEKIDHFAATDHEAGPAIFYGVLRGCGDAMRHCELVGRDYFHIDAGYFGRGHFAGYYRVTKNAPQVDGTGSRPNDRALEQGWAIRAGPTNIGERPVLVAPPSPVFADFIGINRAEWIRRTIDILQINTDRQVVLTSKGENHASSYFGTAWALVTYCSNAAVEAAMHEIPVFVDGPSAAYWVSTGTFDLIETPCTVPPETYLQWMANLAYAQFTLAEFKDGTAWEILND